MIIFGAMSGHFVLLALLFSAFFLPKSSDANHSLLSATNRLTLEVECNNHCAFNGVLENNCQGVRFTKNQKFFYTSYSKVFDRCIHSRLPRLRVARPEEVSRQCSCGPPLGVPIDRSLPLQPETRQKLISLQERVKTWAFCAPDPDQVSKPTEDIRFPLAISDIRPCGEFQREGIRGNFVAPGCLADRNYGCGYYGNNMNASGIYCFLGDIDRCEDVRLGQDSATGAWYRNPYQRRFPLSEQGQPAFSRDEFLGVMLYLSKTGDKNAALKWLEFIEANPKIPSSVLSAVRLGRIDSVHSICPPLPKIRPSEIPADRWKAMLPDDRCEMRPDSWGLFYLVLKSISASDSEIRSRSGSIYAKMKLSYPTVIPSAAVTAMSVPASGASAFQGSLAAETLLLLNELRPEKQTLFRAAIQSIHRRSGQTSPFYEWLSQGQKPSEYGANLILKYCPDRRPYYGGLSYGQAVPAASFFSSATQYFGGLNSHGLKDEPVGHDCLNWIRIYLNPNN